MHKNATSDHFNHPIYDALWSGFDTLAYREFEESVTYWLWTGAPGGFVSGPSRSGKTSALERIVKDLRWRDGRKPVTVSIEIGEDDIVTITEVWRSLCRQIGMRVKSRMSSNDLRESFYAYLLDQCFERDLKQVVIFVDEVQRLSMRQLGAFVRLHDNLRKWHIRVVCVLVANEDESSMMLDDAGEKRYSHKRGRFFEQRHYFSGIKDKEALQRCLAQYDTLRFPADGPTFTEYFLPEAFAAGWRMQSLSPLIWTQFRAYKRQFGVRSMGMQYFRQIADSLLQDVCPNIDPFLISPDIVQACFDDSGLLASSVSAG